MVPSILPHLVIENPTITLMKNRQFIKNKIETFLTTLDQNLQQETLFKKQLNKFQEGFTHLTELTETSNSTDVENLNDEIKIWNRDMSMKNFDDRNKLLSLEKRVKNIRYLKDNQSQLLGYSNKMQNVVSLYKTMIDEKTLKDKENLLAFKGKLANLDAIITLEEPFFMPIPKGKLSKLKSLNDTNGDKSKLDTLLRIENKIN
jgi:hypothetical protein